MTMGKHVIQITRFLESVSGHEGSQNDTRPLDDKDDLDGCATSDPPDRDEAALIILNTPLDDFEYVCRLHAHAAYVVCADGGANRLYDLVKRSCQSPSTAERTSPSISVSASTDHSRQAQRPGNTTLGTARHENADADADVEKDQDDDILHSALRKLLPDAIHGDLDSLLPHVRDVYSSLGVHVTRDADQYSTDFGKAVRLIRAARPHVRHILVLGSLGGRVDQGVGLLHELYREQSKVLSRSLASSPSSAAAASSTFISKADQHDQTTTTTTTEKDERDDSVDEIWPRFWFFTKKSISILLFPGTTRISTPLRQKKIDKAVGVLPLYGPAKISMRGFEWDVADWPTEMGGQVSTSNYIVADTIEIETDRTVLFTVERRTKENK